MSVLDRFRLDGRVALVTGGTKGLGRSMATGFVEMNQSILANPEVYQSFVARIPLGRWGELEEI